jgi:hypothetical protein
MISYGMDAYSKLELVGYAIGQNNLSSSLKTDKDCVVNLD